MFCVLDENENIIAYHENKSIVKKYVGNIYRCHSILLTIKKYKKNDSIYTNLPDLYLVRYADTYVQAGYLLYIQLLSDQVDYDHEYVRDILLRILEITTLSKKEKKHLEKSVEIIDKMLANEKRYTPTIQDLKSIKTDYDPYFYNAGIYDM